MRSLLYDVMEIIAVEWYTNLITRKYKFSLNLSKIERGNGRHKNYFLL